jgi:hypothetical protein
MVRGHMKCCPSAVKIFFLKGHTIPYLVRNVWYLVRNMWLPSRCTSHSSSTPYPWCRFGYFMLLLSFQNWLIILKIFATCWNKGKRDMSTLALLFRGTKKTSWLIQYMWAQELKSIQRNLTVISNLPLSLSHPLSLTHHNCLEDLP